VCIYIPKALKIKISRLSIFLKNKPNYNGTFVKVKFKDIIYPFIFSKNKRKLQNKHFVTFVEKDDKIMYIIYRKKKIFF